MALAPSDLAFLSGPPPVRYYRARGFGYIGPCAVCDEDICGQAEDWWRVQFVLARDPLGQRRMHLACMPAGTRCSRPVRPLQHWDWEDGAWPKRLSPV